MEDSLNGSSAVHLGSLYSPDCRNYRTVMITTDAAVSGRVAGEPYWAFVAGLVAAAAAVAAVGGVCRLSWI